MSIEKKTGIIYSTEFLKHNTGQFHPESEKRLESIIEKLYTTNYFYKLETIVPILCSEKQIELVHEPEYINNFRILTEKGSGFFDNDTPYSKDSYSIAKLAVGGGLQLADKIWEGSMKNGMVINRPPGHHAEKSFAMGFCFFNNIAILAKYLLQKGFSKIFILDWDVHHGNGTEHIFYEDSNVFFLSLHQYPFYPGTGSEFDRGKGKGEGFNLNIPLPKGANEEDYLDQFTEKVIPALEDFLPDIILISAGFDAHKNDPLGGMKLTTNSFEKFTRIIVKKSQEICNGRLISYLEGGYDLIGLAESVEAHVSVLLHG